MIWKVLTAQLCALPGKCLDTDRLWYNFYKKICVLVYAELYKVPESPTDVTVQIPYTCKGLNVSRIYCISMTRVLTNLSNEKKANINIKRTLCKL